jgi:hypothetical protein
VKRASLGSSFYFFKTKIDYSQFWKFPKQPTFFSTKKEVQKVERELELFGKDIIEYTQ